jgi:hypothetical protein
MSTEMKAQHTPGPWRAEVQPDCSIARIYGPKHSDGGEYAALFETSNHANARLIASAPELLEALKDAELTTYQYEQSLLAQGNEAAARIYTRKYAAIAKLIAKAEGR